MKYCLICDRSSENFKPYGLAKRENAMCPICGSLERDRLSWLYIKEHTDFLSSKLKKMLHVAPEKILAKKFSDHLDEGYISADLYDQTAMIKMDLMDIKFDDESFDYVYCSHVLEHIEDDKKAMREIHRVLKDSGWAILNVPIINGKTTYEDFSITSPQGRLEAFGQSDHVRSYGLDYKDRLMESGFCVKVIYPQDLLSADDMQKMSISSYAGEIFFCTKS